MNTTLAIIGSHPRTRDKFDMSRTDADVWLFNEAISNPANHSWAKHADAVFQMHIPTIWRNPANRNDPHHYEWLKTQTDCDVWMQEEYPEVPKARRYPLEGILAMNGEGAHFLTSSVPQAMALAAYLGSYTRVEIYGVAMETNTEYQFQREGVSHWYGFLRGRGVDVYFADPTFEAPLYGYEGKVSIDYEAFDSRIVEVQPWIDELTPQYRAASMETVKAVQLLTLDGSKDAENTLFACVQKQVNIGSQLGHVEGARQENQKYKAKADKMREADDGNHLFSRQEFESAAKALADKAQEEEVKRIMEGTKLGIIQDNLRRAAKGSPKRNTLANDFLKVAKAYMDTVNQKAIYEGAAQENFGYMEYLDKHIRAAGGAKSEAVLLESMAVNAP